MKVLALDTSTDACSAAVYADGAVYERFELAPRRHAQILLSMLEAVLTEAKLELPELTGIAFGRGPGSFTGVRIAASTAQAVAIGADLPVVPVSSLRALAQTAFRLYGLRRCAVALDARMDEVYFGAFEIGGDDIARPVQEERVCRPEDVPSLPGTAWSGVGPGWKPYEPRLRERLRDCVGQTYANLYPRARDVAALGAFGLQTGEAVPAEAALPVYLRDRVTRA